MQRRDGRLLQQEINCDTERFAALHVDFVSTLLLNGVLNRHAWNPREETRALLIPTLITDAIEVLSDKLGKSFNRWWVNHWQQKTWQAKDVATVKKFPLTIFYLSLYRWATYVGVQNEKTKGKLNLCHTGCSSIRNIFRAVMFVTLHVLAPRTFLVLPKILCDIALMKR